MSNDKYDDHNEPELQLQEVETPEEGHIWLNCVSCSRKFFFKDSERAFYESQGYALPIRCWNCRKRRAAQKNKRAKNALYQGAEVNKPLWKEDDKE